MFCQFLERSTRRVGAGWETRVNQLVRSEQFPVLVLLANRRTSTCLLVAWLASGFHRNIAYMTFFKFLFKIFNFTIVLVYIFVKVGSTINNVYERREVFLKHFSNLPFLHFQSIPNLLFLNLVHLQRTVSSFYKLLFTHTLSPHCTDLFYCITSSIAPCQVSEN